MKSDDDSPIASQDAVDVDGENGAADLGALVARGNASAAAGDLDAAEEAFTAALALDRENEDALHGMAHFLRSQSRYDEATSWLTEGLRAHPKSAALLEERALLFFDQENFEEGVAGLDRLVQAAPDSERARMLKLLALRFLGRFDEAEQVIGEALERFPKSGPLLMERGSLFFAEGRYPEAAEAFARVIELDSNDIAALEWKIVALRFGKDYGAAERELAEGLARHPDSVPLLIQQGWVDYEQDRYETAAAAFDRALALDERSEPAHTFKVAALRLAGDVEAAEAAIEHALVLIPNSLPLRSERGWLYFVQRRYDEASTCFEELLGEPAADAAARALAFEGHAASLRLRRHFDEAETALAEALTAFPTSVALLNQRGWLRFDQQEYGQAVESFEQAIAISPNDEAALEWRIRSLRFLRRFEEAERAVQEALERQPQSATLLNQRGWLHYDQKQYEEAVAAFTATLERDPADASAHEGKAASLRLLRRFDEAEEALEGALALRPDSVPLLNQRGWLHYDQKDYEAAVTLFEHAIALDEDDEAALQWRIAALRALRRFPQAEEAASEALRRLPASSPIQIERGWLYLDEKQYARAERAFAKAAELAPESPQPLLAQLQARVEAVPDRPYDDLVRRLRKAFKDDPAVRDELGWFHIRQSKLDEAERDFKAILAVDPNHPLGLHGLGGIAAERDDYIEAERKFRLVEDRYQDDPAFLCNLAWTLARQSEPEKHRQAEELCGRALESDRYSTRAYECLSYLAERRGDLSGAERYLRGLESSDATRGDSALGALYSRVGRFSDARQRLLRAIANDPDDATSYRWLGFVRLDENDTRAAVHEFRRAVSIDPVSEEAQRGLAIALFRGGRPQEAERVLREAIVQLEETNPWRLRLTLAWILSAIGDEAGADSAPGGRRRARRYYEEALSEVEQAKLSAPEDRDPLFHSGVIRAKLDDFFGARREFKKCVRLNKADYEAQRQLDTVSSWIAGGIFRSSYIGGVVIGLVAVLNLIALWVLFLLGQISATVLVTLLPIFMGLLVVAFLLPSLIRLKLPGMDAQLSEPERPVADRTLEGIDWRDLAFTRPTPARASAGGPSKGRDWEPTKFQEEFGAFAVAMREKGLPPGQP